MGNAYLGTPDETASEEKSGQKAKKGAPAEMLLKKPGQAKSVAPVKKTKAFLKETSRDEDSDADAVYLLGDEEPQQKKSLAKASKTKKAGAKKGKARKGGRTTKKDA